MRGWAVGLLAATLAAALAPLAAARATDVTDLGELTAQIAAGADELGRLGGELRAVDLDLARASAVEQGARLRADAARQRVADAEARVADVDRELAQRSDALAQRAIHLYRQGGGEVDLLGALGLTGAELVVRLPYLEALARSDATLIEETEAAMTVAGAIRGRVVELRDEAELQERLAQETTLTVESYRRQQRLIVSAARATEARRADLLFALEQDAAAREELARRLEAQAAVLSASIQTDVDDDWVARLPSAGQLWREPLLAAARRNGIDPRLLAAVVWTESTFRPEVVSPAGAVGLAQLLPSTARLLGVDPYEPEQNLEGGARYLAQLLDRYLGRPELAVAAYNAGPGDVDDAGGIPNFPETQVYVTRVLGHYEELSRE